MGSIGNEAKPEFFSKEKKTLQNIVMTRKLHGTAIAKVSHHGQSIVHGFL